MTAYKAQNLSGWGRYPVAPCRVYRPARVRDVGALLTGGEQRDFICRGLGRSYGDAAVNTDGGVILHEQLNRLLGFDAKTGVVECEGGASLATILEVFVPRGFFLPVTPGTKYVTVGGAIAADVHGKNHHRDGSLGRFVLDFALLTASGQVMRCSPTENARVFWATVGGMGLTGAILSARLQLMPVETAYLNVDYRKARNLDQALEMFGATDQAYRYSVAWVDCLAGGKALGRSVLMLGNHAAMGDLPSRWRARPLSPRAKLKQRVPFEFPGFVLNSWSVRAFNTWFYGTHYDGQAEVIDYDRYFYPLDSILHWNRIYGRRGFVQYQAVLPPAQSRKGLIQLLERLAAARAASFLAVLKTMGPENPGLLSFPASGHTLALDIPFAGAGTLGLLAELDRIVLDHGGRVYLAKDACTTAATLAAMYPRLGEFRQVKAEVDPRNVWSSTQSRRLALTPARGGAA